MLADRICAKKQPPQHTGLALLLLFACSVAVVVDWCFAFACGGKTQQQTVVFCLCLSPCGAGNGAETTNIKSGAREKQNSKKQIPKDKAANIITKKLYLHN